MTATVTIPIVGYSISINSLIAIALLLFIFFTFFSVSITFAGLNPTTAQKGRSPCSHSGNLQAEVQLALEARKQLQALRSSFTREMQ